MVAGATVRVMSPEEIASRAAGETPFLHWPQRSTFFAEREMRLRQLSHGHAMGDFLVFMADLAHAQQARLKAMEGITLPDARAIDEAARRGVPALPAADWPRDRAWHGVLKAMVTELKSTAPAGVQPTLQRLAEADEVFLERQADALLTGVMAGLDLACAPIVAGALQVYWTHMVLAVQQHHHGQGQPFGRIDDETVCPCCGSRPTASITRSAGESLGQRYLHCSLCGMQWHMVRIKCPHCLSTKSLAYHSLDAADHADDKEVTTSRAALATVQAETCDDCGHYLKMVHTDRDPFVDPVADDLASLTLDLLVSDTGKQRSGVNLMLLFGEPDPPDTDPHPGGG
jgi:FdhE protein